MSVPSQSRPGRADRRSVGGFAKKLFVGLGYLSCVHDRILSGSLFGMGDQLAARSGFDRARLISAEITWKKFGGSPAQFHASEKSVGDPAPFFFAPSCFKRDSEDIYFSMRRPRRFSTRR
jgi:hypothetical protein